MSSKNNLEMVGESLPGKWWGSLDFGSQAPCNTNSSSLLFPGTQDNGNDQ